MTKHQFEHRARLLKALEPFGVTDIEFEQLLRAERVLHRWAELECGNSDYFGSWAIERDDNGPPYMVRHNYRHGQSADIITRTRMPDREAGARRRVDAICKAHGLTPYYQTDPRGCALYLLRPGDLATGQEPDSGYTNGLAICID